MPLPPELFAEAISPKQLLFVAITFGFLAVTIPIALRFDWMDRVCLVGLLFFSIDPIDVTFFSYTNYRGDIRGVEFGITDWFIIVMIVTMSAAPRWRKYKLYTRNPNEIWMALYLGICALSIVTAIIPQFAAFGFSKMVRAYGAFWVAYNYIRKEEDLRFIIGCFIALAFWDFWGILMDKYVRGIFPPRSPFTHQNTLATFQNILNFIIFAVMLQDTDKLFDKRMMVYWAAFGAGAITTIATLSRGGLMTMILGCAMVLGMTFFLKQKQTKIRKKLSAVGIMFLLSLPALAVVLPPIIERFETAPEASGESRHGANDASAKMGQDYFWGVGLNNYSFAINNMEYGEELNPLDRGIAHHIFWLHYAELGILGVAFYTLMTGNFMLITLRFILKRRDSLERVFAIGVLAAFVINWLIGTLEWVFRQIPILLVYFLLAGFVCSLERVERERIGEEKKKRSRLALLHWMLSQKNQARKPPPPRKRRELTGSRQTVGIQNRNRR